MYLGFLVSSFPFPPEFDLYFLFRASGSLKLEIFVIFYTSFVLCAYCIIITWFYPTDFLNKGLVMASVVREVVRPM